MSDSFTAVDVSTQPNDESLNTQGNMSGDVAGAVADSMLQAGHARAQKLYSSYAKVDILRPYFQVETHEVRSRLLQSFVPIIPSRSNLTSVTTEFYGPVMLVLTLVSVLLFDMKHGNTQIGEGTLIGTAMFAAFSYWLGGSMLCYALGMGCKTEIRMAQAFVLTGYGLTQYCLALFIGSFHSLSETFFIICWIIFGGLSSSRIASMYICRTPNKQRWLPLAAGIFSIHFFFIFYLRWSYHTFLAELEDTFASIAANQ